MTSQRPDASPEPPSQSHDVPDQPHDVTLTGVLTELSGEGYDGDFFVRDDGGVCCGSCRTCLPAADLHVDGIRRLEGASDPADMAIVIALRCGSCGTKGTSVLRYGPEASAGEAEVLLRLDDRRGDGLDVAESNAT